jgi:uncharacterized protein (TIRG00374 family)
MADFPENKQPVLINWNKLIKRISVIVGIGVLVNLAIVLFFSKSFDARILLSFHPAYIALGFLVGVLPIFLHAWTLKLWGDCFEKQMAYRDSLQVAATSLLGSAVTPTMFGGGPLKLGLLVMHGFRAGQAAAVVSMGSIQDGIAFLLLIPLSIYLSKSVDLNMVRGLIRNADVQPVTYAIVVLAVIAAVVLLVFIAKRTARGGRIIERIRLALVDFKSAYALILGQGKTYFLVTMIITLARWFCIYFVLIALVAGLKLAAVDYLEVWSLQWIVFSGMTFTPLPGGAGGAEAVFYLTYKGMFPEAVVVALIFAWRFLEAYLKYAIAALVVIFLSRPKQG